MWKLLIVDDEPLVVTGLQTILHWSDYDIDICALAYNGQEALQLIEQHHPDIVITDIKMPLMSGVELMKTCHERYGTHPVFILLSSYEDFSYAKEAIHCDAVEYLIKMDLTPDLLVNAVTAAVNKLKSMHYAPESTLDIHGFYDKFFIRLLYHLFENPNQYTAQTELLGLNLDARAYACTYCKIAFPMEMPFGRLATLSQSVLSMTRELLSHYCTAHVVALDTERLAIIFCLNDAQMTDFNNFVTATLKQINETLHSYFNLTVTTITGTPYSSPLQVSVSFNEAKLHKHLATRHQPIYICKKDVLKIQANTYLTEEIHELFSKALTEYDAESLDQCFKKLAILASTPDASYTSISDTGSNLLFMTKSLLPDGEEVMRQIFGNVQKDYRAFYHFASSEQIFEWMNTLHLGLLTFFNTKKKDHKNNTVYEIQKYLQSNLHKKLSLNEVANTFGLSPNYLSSIFKKTCECTFTEYMNQCKVNEAKRLLETSSMKIYEISHQLGFDDAFYFSKVFKKIEGCSPKEYIQNSKNNL